jgi:hypothetical protein
VTIPATDDAFISSRARGSGRSRWFQLLCEIGSVRMAAILIAALATVIGSATVYERAYGSQVTTVMVYQAWWFTTLFAILGACLIAAVVVRLPLRRHQWGFAVVHLGLLVLMGGFWMHGHHRLDGMLEAAPGAEAARIELPTDALIVVDGDKRRSAVFQPITYAGYPSLLGFLARDLWLDPPPRINELSSPRMLLDNDGLRAELTAVLDTGGSDLGYAHAATGQPAVLLSLAARTPGAGLQPFARDWLVPGGQTISDQGMLLASMMVARSPYLADGFNAPLPPAGDDGELIVGLADRSVRVPVVAGAVSELGPDLALRVERVLRNPAQVGDRLEQDDGARLDPVVEYSIGMGPAETRTWTRRYAAALLLAASEPGFPDVLYAHPQVYSPSGGQGAYLQLLIVPGDAGSRLLLRWFTRSKGLSGTAEVSSTWSGDLAGSADGPMQLRATVDWLPHAQPAPEPVSMLPGKQDRAMRWAHIRLSDGTTSTERWFHRDEVAAVDLGAKTLFVSYRRAVYDLREQHGFAIRLERFDEGKDPGGMRSASFSSEVSVLPASGDPIPALITMNEPLHHAGVTLYQTAFRPETDGKGQPTGRQVSVFTAATDPGRIPKYLGSLLLVGGIIMLFLMRRTKST